MTKYPVIIDCDPGIDDAVALSLAFSARDELKILAITTVAGNVPLELTARNARIMRQLAGREDVPIYAGCSVAMEREPVFAEEFHGEDGLEGIEPFEPKVPLGEGHAVTNIVDVIRNSSEPVQVIATGPLTNIAGALMMAPEIGSNISELVLMGGADTEGGNITPFAEFNIFADPHAAALVFDRYFRDGTAPPITVFSLDFTHTVRNTPERIDAVRRCGGRLAAPTANLLIAINKFEKKMVGTGTGPLHDPCTVAYALVPDMFSYRTGRVDVVTQKGERFGQTRFENQARGVKWITSTPGEDVSEKIYQLIIDRIGSYV